MKEGTYLPPERIAFSNLEAFGDYDPAVSKDDRFLIFSSPRPPAPAHQADLFLVRRKDAGWSEPVDLRLSVSPDVYGAEARPDPAERTLFFTNARKLPSDRGSDEHAIVIHSWQVELPPQSE